MRVLFILCLFLMPEVVHAQSTVHALPEYTYIPPAVDKYEWERVLHIKGRCLLHNAVACSDSLVFSFGGYEGAYADYCGPVVRTLSHLEGKHLRGDTLHYPGKGFMNDVFFVRDSLLFIGGGRDSCLSTYSWADFWQYNQRSGQWKQLADLPFYYKYKPYLFREGGRILVLVPRLEDQQFERSNVLLYEYDIAADRWTIRSKALPSITELLPAGCAGAQQHLWPVAFMLDKYIYVLFQTIDTRGKKPGCTSTFYRCHVDTGEWTRLPSFPGYLESFAFGASDGTYGYIGGGYAFSRAQRREVYRYDPELAKWERITDLPSGAAYANAWNFGGDTYVGFGRNEQDNTVSIWRMKYRKKRRK